jgi:hypothetical protein
MVFLAMAENEGGRLPSKAPRDAATSCPDGVGKKSRASNRVSLKEVIGRANVPPGFIGIFSYSEIDHSRLANFPLGVKAGQDCGKHLQIAGAAVMK